MTFPLTMSASALALLLAQSAVLLLAAAVASRMMRGSSAAVRHLVWATTLGLLLLLPMARLLVPQVDVPVLPAIAASAAASSAALEPIAAAVPEIQPLASSPAGPMAPVVESEKPARPDFAISEQARSSSETATASATIPAPALAPRIAAVVGMLEAVIAFPWTLILVGTWLSIALLLLARVALSHLQLRALRRHAWVEDDPRWTVPLRDATRALGITRPVTLLATEDTAIPMTWGTLAPVVLVPADSDGWDDARRRAVLVHELAHVARRDALTHEIGRVAAAIYWPNPLVWVALRAMRAERERACDDLVLRSGLRASSYAADLLDIARGLSIRPVAVAALAMARRSELEGRLLSILDPRAERSVPGRVARVAVAAMALTLVVPLSALRPASAAAVRMTPETSAAFYDMPEHIRASSSLGTAEERASASEPESTLAQSSDLWARDAASEAPVPAAMHPTSSIGLPANGVTPTTAPTLQAPPQSSVAIPETVMRSPPNSALPADERETLIAVAVAARRMSSDFEKAELLLEIASNYMSDDELRAAYLATAATVKGNYDRHRVLLGLLSKDSLLARGSVDFLKVAGGLTSSHEKATVLTRFVATHPLAGDAERTAFFTAAGTLGGHELAVLLTSITKKPWFDAKVAVPLLAASKNVSSSYTRADVLVAVARTGVLSDETARKAFLTAAESLTTDSDYGRVMAAAAGRRRG